MKFRNMLASTLAITLIAGNMAFAAPAPKLDENALYAKAAQRLFSLELIQGKNATVGVAAEDTLNRAELYQILLSLKGIDIEDYADVDAGFEDTIGWNQKVANAAKALKMTDGVSATKFAPDAKVEHIQAVAAILKTLGYNDEIQGVWGDDLLEIAKEKGIDLNIDSLNFNASIKRGNVFYLVDQALDVEQFNGDKLIDEVAGRIEVQEVSGVAKAVDGKVEINGKAYVLTVGKVEDLNGKDVTVVVNKDNEIVAIKEVSAQVVLAATVKQSGKAKIAVEFNRALTTEEKAAMKFTVKNGFVPYNVTATYNEENTVATLEAAYAFPAGDYKVEVTGLEAATVKVETEKVDKIEIQNPALQVAVDQNLGVKAFNQFGEEITNAGLEIKLFVKGAEVLGFDPVKVNLSGYAKDDMAVVTAYHAATGKTASKTYKLIEKSSVVSIQFGAVAPLKDKTRISVSEEGLEIPYTLKDQYGNDVKFPANTTGATLGDVNFVSSDSAIVNPADFKTDKDGKLFIKTGTKAGTVVITAINSKNGTNANLTIKVEEASKLKSFQMNHPGVLVAEKEDVKIPFIALDSFGSAIKDFTVGLADGNDVKITTLGNVRVTKAVYNSNKGEMTFAFEGKGTTTVFAWVNGQIASQFNVEVKEEAKLERIIGVKNIQTLFAVDGSVTVEAKNLNIIDNYGRTVEKEVPFTVVKKDTAAKTVKVEGAKITGVEAGTERLTVSLTGVTNSSYDFDVKVIKDEDIKTYELKSIGTLYKSADAKYAKEIVLVGKDASGKEVAIDQTKKITALTSSNNAIATADLTTLKVAGVAKGSAVITAWNGATKLAEINVEVSEDLPVAKTVEFKNADETVAVNEIVDLKALLTVKDQYGVVIDNAQGTWTSSNKAVATVAADGKVTTIKAGEATIAFVTSNGIPATVKVIADSTATPTNPDVVAVAAAKAALTVSYNGTDATITLPATGANGTTVAWTSNNVAINATTGVVTRPAEGAADVTVTLTATITKGTVNDTKTFTITVKAQEAQVPTKAEWLSAPQGAAGRITARVDTTKVDKVVIQVEGATDVVVTTFDTDGSFIVNVGTMKLATVIAYTNNVEVNRATDVFSGL